MSLETKIELLTAAIDKLNANMGMLVGLPLVSDPKLAAQILEREMPTVKPKPEPVEPEPTPETSEPALSYKDVQDFVLSLTRADMKVKGKIRALLSEYSASKISDIELDKLAEFKARLAAL